MSVAPSRRLAAALVALAVAGSAAAASAASGTTPRPAAGTATSDLTLLSLSVGGHPLTVGHLALAGGSADGSAVFTPLTSGGTSYHPTSASSGTVSIPSLSSDGVFPPDVSRLVTVTTPGASMTSRPGLARAAVDSFGRVSVLGLPLTLDGTASTTTIVDGLHAGSDKTLVVRNLALPSIGGLLGALGLDLNKLPATTLSTLVEQLGLVNGTIRDARAALDAALAPLQPQLTAAQQQVGSAQVAVDAAKADVAAKTSALGTATTTLDATTQTLQAALGTVPHLVRANLLGLPTVLPSPSAPAPTAVPAAALPSVLPSALPPPVPTVVPTVLPSALPTTVPTALPTSLPTVLPTALPSALPTVLPAPSVPPVVPAPVQPALDAYNAASADYSTALSQLNAATGALDLANGLLNTASSAVNSLLSTVSSQVADLVHAIVDVLGRTPLVSVDSFTVQTEASASSADPGGQVAKIVSGEVQGVRVLGDDVLQQTLNTDHVDLQQLTAAQLELLNGRIEAVTGTLSAALSSVPGLPTLSVPPPQVQLLSSTSSTGSADGFGTAGTTVQALQVTLPALTIPSAVQAPSAVGALRVQALGDVLTQPLSLGVGTLQDTARFRAAVLPSNGTGAPGSNPVGSSLTGSNPTGSTGSSPTGSNPTGSNPTDSNPQADPVARTPVGSVPGGSPTASGPGTSPTLPRTGLPPSAGLLALGCCAAGLLLRRRAVG